MDFYNVDSRATWGAKEKPGELPGLLFATSILPREHNYYATGMLLDGNGLSNLGA